MLSRLPGAATICCALVAAAGIAAAAPAGVVTDVRHGRHPDFTRVVIETSQAVDAPVRQLPADPAARRPDRLYLDLEGIGLGARRARVVPVRDARVHRVRLGEKASRETRVVIDLASASHYRLMHLSEPPRIVIDVFDGGEPPVWVAFAPEAEPAPPPTEVSRAPAAPLVPEPPSPPPPTAPPSPAPKPVPTDPPLTRSFGDALDAAMEFTTTVTLEAAVGTRHGHFQKSALAFEPEIELELPWGLDLKTTGRLRFDGFDRLDPGEPRQPEVSHLSRRGHIGDQGEYELREFYVDREFGDLFLRAGKQHVVWGKADGLKVLDLVNPQDFREFVLEDFEDSRIPLWALHAELPIRDVTAQLVWILDQSYHDLTEGEDLYAFATDQLVAAVPPFVTLEFDEVRRPRRVIRDSDVGLRLSTFFRGWDLTLNYLQHYDDVPVLARSVALVPFGGIVVRVSPRYERTDLVGGTFSNAFGDFTVRGEVGYSFRKSFTTLALSDLDGVAESDELGYVLGLDWFGMSETFVSAQLFQRIVRDHLPGFTVQDRDTTYSFLARRDFLNDVLQVEVLWVHNRNVGDGFVRPKVIYDLTDDLRAWLGADLFYGRREGLFGQFDDLDRIVLGLEYTR